MGHVIDHTAATAGAEVRERGLAGVIGGADRTIDLVLELVPLHRLEAGVGDGVEAVVVECIIDQDIEAAELGGESVGDAADGVAIADIGLERSEERRVGEECRGGWWGDEWDGKRKGEEDA